MDTPPHGRGPVRGDLGPQDPRTVEREGWDVGKYLVYRLYKEEGLALKKMRPQRKRRAVKHREERFLANSPSQAWSIDLVADQLQDRRRFRALTIVDVFTREAVAIEIEQSLEGGDVVRTMNQLKNKRGVPRLLPCDNGSESTSQAMDLWAYQNGVKIDFSRPGKPTDNAFVESFNPGSPRTGLRPWGGMAPFGPNAWTPTGSRI